MSTSDTSTSAAGRIVYQFARQLLDQHKDAYEALSRRHLGNTEVVDTMTALSDMADNPDRWLEINSRQAGNIMAAYAAIVVRFFGRG